MAHKKVQLNPGFYKLFDELVVNARDARIRSITTANPIKAIGITVKDEGEGLVISVENDGEGITIAQHPEHKVWVPELIFGHLLTSGNYDKAEEKIVGGKNGYGAKLVNVFSHEFKVEVRHPGSGQKYTQVWKDHMSKCEKPSVRADKGKGYVEVTYTPDLGRFVGFVKEDLGQSGPPGSGAAIAALAPSMAALLAVPQGGEGAPVEGVTLTARACACCPARSTARSSRSPRAGCGTGRA
jgi:DNA topoisomerase-2